MSLATPGKTDQHGISHGFGRVTKDKVTNMEVHQPFVYGIALRSIVS